MDFLSQVNVFHGRAQNGKALVGEWVLDYPQYAGTESRPAQVYIRPHELEIDRHPLIGGGSLATTVVHVNPVGSTTRVELNVSDFGLNIHVDMTPDRYAALRPVRGEIVYVAPRRARVFLPEYSI